MCRHCSNPNLRPAMMDHRRWAFYNIGARMVGSSGQPVSGPAPMWRTGQPMPAIVAERRLESQMASERAFREYGRLARGV